MYSASTLSSTTPQDAYVCAGEQLKTLGYRVMAHDDETHRVVAERDNPEIRDPSGLFKRGFDRFEITTVPDASGKTALAIKAQSYKESLTARGNNQDEIQATAKAKADSKTVMAACAAD